jgi:hypothetical protein
VFIVHCSRGITLLMAFKLSILSNISALKLLLNHRVIVCVLTLLSSYDTCSHNCIGCYVGKNFHQMVKVIHEAAVTNVCPMFIGENEIAISFKALCCYRNVPVFEWC